MSPTSYLTAPPRESSIANWPDAAKSFFDHLLTKLGLGAIAPVDLALRASDSVQRCQMNHRTSALWPRTASGLTSRTGRRRLC